MSRQSVQAGKAVIIIDLVDKATSSFKKVQSGMMNAARSFRDLGSNSAGAALLTGVPIGKGLGNYAKFTNSIQNIEAKLGNFGQTSAKVRQDSNALRQEIIQLGRDTAYTSTEIADAAGALAAGGFQNPKDIQASLKAIADLGRGTKMALEDAAKMSISIATTFKLFREGDSGNNSLAMTTLADQLVKAGRLSIAGADDMGASLVYVAQKAADLGVTVPEVLTLLNQLAQAGIKGSVAGTSLNTAFGNLTNNLSKIKEQFPNFEIIFKKDGSINAIETFGKLGQLMKNMGKIPKTQFLQDVFNLRGERAASALEDIEGMRRGLQDIKNSAGEASKSAQTMQAGFGGALERIGGAIDAVYNKIGTKFDKQLKGTAEIIALVIDQVDKLSTKYLALTAAIILSPAIFASIAIGALSLSFVLARLSTVVGVLLKGFKGIKSIGSVMLGGAKSLLSPIAAISNSRSVKAAAIKKTSEKIAKLQTALDISYAKASAKKVGAAQAIIKVSQSKKQAELISNVFKLKKLQAGSSILGNIKSLGSISGLAKAAINFTKFSAALIRFTFSWNAVGLALNLLILFGDKIPAVSKAFKDLGAGFSAAFFQIGRIAEYGAPALSLFSLAIEAFSSGNTAIGVRALAEAFKGIVDIIQNQLSAAWSAFSMKVSDLWLTLTKIGTAIFSVFSTLFMGLGEIIGNAFEGVSDRVSKLFSGKGESTFMSGLMTVALSLNNFISAFSESIIRLEDWGGKFLNTIQDIANGKITMKAASEIPGNIDNFLNEPYRNFLIKIGKMTKEDKAAIENKRLGIGGEQAKENPRIASIEAERLKREKELVDLFSKNSDPIKEKNRKDAVNANERSDTASQIMKNRFEMLLVELTLTIEAQTEKVKNAAVKPPFVENMDQGGLEGTVQRFVTKLDALVGSLGETRNLYKIDKPDTISEIKKTNQKLDNINQTIKTSGLIGH